jgi:UDP-glucose 4-epimerase
MSKILVTGGAGYIGTHTCVELLNKGEEIVVLDNFSNSNPSAIDAVEKITGKSVKVYEGNMIDREILEKIFTENDIDAVIDFAAYKAVGESVQKPVEYYTNNVSTVLVLLDEMKKHNVKTLVFSSSATVYGDPERIPITEDCRVGGTTNPYGTSKLMVEQILQDLYKSDNEWNIAILRYFNPVGAHESGLIGEDPKGIPANLMPFISKVAAGKLPQLSVFGNDYDTKDGTGVRDYIHVVDLACGHINALDKLKKDGSGMHIYNLGTGVGYSVLDMINAFEKANNIKVPYKIVDRRPGDIATCYSDPTKAREEIGFVAKKSLEDMCRDAWNFEHNKE